jgi:RadC-like JAB domain
MSATILPQPHGSENRRVSEFVKLAFDELVQKYPHWYEQDQTCLEHGYWLASTGGVKEIGVARFEVNHDLPDGKPYVVDAAAQTCTCPDYVALTGELGQPLRCSHRIAVYLQARARELQRQFDTEWQRFVRETCDGDPRGYLISEDEQEYLIVLAESKVWHAAQAKKGYSLSEGEGQGHQAREQLPLFGASPLDEEKLVAMSRLQTIRRTYIPVVDFRIVRESSIAVEASQIKSPADAANILFAYFEGLTREHLVVLTLNQKNRMTAIQTVYIGSVHTTVVRVGELFQLPVYKCAPAIIVAHNHPSGEPGPSPEDVALTREIVKAGHLLDIDLLDHLVVGDQKFVSLKERGLGFEVKP